MTTVNFTDALPIGKLCLSRLRRQCSSVDASQWADAAATVNNALVQLITAEAPTFWATLIYKEDVRSMLDSIADFYIRVNFFNESIIYVVDERVKMLYEKIYENNFFVYLRILSYESNQKVFFSPTAYAVALYGRRVINIQRLVKMVSIYGRANEKLCVALVANTFVAEPRFHNDLNDFVVTTEQFFERVKSFLDDLSGSLENRRVALDVSHVICLLRILDNAVNVALSLSVFMRVFTAPAARRSNVWLGFLNNLPSLVDNVACVLSDGFLALVACCAPAAVDRFLGYLAHRRTLLLQAIMQLFFSFYNSSELSEKDRLMTLYDAVVCKEFLVRFDDAVGVRKEFSRFLQLGACDEEHLRTAEKLLNNAYAERARAIKTVLAQKYVLKDIGHPTAAGLKEMLHSLMDLLPNYSSAQLHLCLKHYNYNADRTTYMLMEPSEMPLDLRIIMRTMDRFDDVNLDTTVVLPAFTDECRDDFDVDSLEKENDPAAATSEAVQSKESVPTAFSILPDDIAVKLSRSPPASIDVSQARERSSKLEAIVSRYGDMFDLSDVAHIIESIDRAKTNDVRELVVENKVFVQSNLERRKLMADKPALTVQEESTIRATYDRYKYEKSDEDDEDGRYDMEERYAASVGRTGRFNKPQALPQLAKPVTSAVTKSMPTIAKRPTQPLFAYDDDEYDDTYDDPDLFAIDDDNKEDNDSAVEKKTNAPPQNVASSSQPDRGKPKNKVNRRFGRNAPSVFSSEARPAAKNGRPDDPPRRTQPPSERYLPSFAKPVATRERYQRDEPSDGENSDNVAPANTNTSQPISGSQHCGPQSSGGSNATLSSTVYTGGRARQNKERNKNKMKQRGADRKMRGGMF